MPDLGALRREQAAFDRQLDELLREHAGEYVVFHGEQVLGFFPNANVAYAEAIERLGPDEQFLMRKVEKPRPPAVSLAWRTGTLVGP